MRSRQLLNTPLSPRRPLQQEQQQQQQPTTSLCSLLDCYLIIMIILWLPQWLSAFMRLHPRAFMWVAFIFTAVSLLCVRSAITDEWKKCGRAEIKMVSKQCESDIHRRVCTEVLKSFSTGCGWMDGMRVVKNPIMVSLFFYDCCLISEVYWCGGVSLCMHLQCAISARDYVIFVSIKSLRNKRFGLIKWVSGGLLYKEIFIGFSATFIRKIRK